MSLITEIEMLRELEQAGTKNVLSWKMLDHAPVMLEVLGCFREGDALAIKSLLVLLRTAKFEVQPDQVERLERLQKAASLMEQEREG